MKRKLRNVIKTIILTAIMLLSTSNICYADVDIGALEGYLNGVVTQQNIHQINNPKYSSRSNTKEVIDPITGNLILQETDISFTGKDGLDLSIGRIYNSAQDEFVKMVSVTSSSSSYTDVVTGYFIEILFYNESSGTIYTNTRGPYLSYEDALEVYYFYLEEVANCVPLGIYLQTTVTYYTTYTVTTKNYPDKYSYNKTRYNLGAGWSFAFPSVQIDEYGGQKYMYYHDESGAVYKILGTADNGNTNLEGYEGKDVKFVEDNGSYINGDGVPSKYKFINSNFTTVYFASDGRLLGIRDRFNNEIKFTHINKQIYDRTYPLIKRIEDSVGRIVDFSYTEYNIELTITAPNEPEQIAITYERYYKTKEASSNGTIIDTYDYPILFKVTDPIGRITYYEDYYFYNNNSFPNERYSYSTKDLTSASASADRYLLGSVVFAGCKTRYEYERVVRNFGIEGATDAYRVKARYDQVQKMALSTTSLLDWTGDYNRVDYVYSGDCTGYPNYAGEEIVPSSYQFWSEARISNGLKTKSIYNGIKQQVQSETAASNNEKKVIKNLEFDSNYKFKPTKTEVIEYASDGMAASTLYIGMTYTTWGGLQSSTLPLTSSQYNDAYTKSRYTTTYSYNNNLYPYFVTQKQSYQNEARLLTESYSYDSLGRVINTANSKGEVTLHSYSVDSNNNRIEEITKNLEGGKVARTKLVYGSETSFAYPKNIINYYTNENGQYVESKTIKTYDMLLGLVRTETDSNGKITSFIYDKIGRVTQKRLPDFTNNYGEHFSVSEVTNFTNAYNLDYIEGNGYLYGTTVEAYTLYVDSNGVQSHYSVVGEFYDAYGNLRNSMSYNSRWINDAKYTYDNLLRVTSIVDAEGNTITASYNAWGENNETTDASGNLYVSNYDVKGNKIMNYFIAKDNIQNYRANVASNTYKEDYSEALLDQYGRVVARKVYENWPVLSGELSELYSYDIAGNLIGYTDPKRNLNEDGYTKSYQYDELNQTIRIKDALNHVTNVNYTVLGKIASVTLKENASSPSSITLYTKAYNELGGMIGKSDSMAWTETYFYNEIGLNTLSSDRNGNTQQYLYNGLNQMDTAYLFSQDHSRSNYYLYSYRNPFGYFDELKYENGTPVAQSHYYYDQKGQIVQKNVYTGNIQSSLKVQYDDTGNLKSLGAVVSNGNYFYSNYGYTNNRLTKVQTNGQMANSTSNSDNAAYEYYPDGKLKKITYPKLNDNTLLTTEYAYNPLGRLTSVANKKGSTILSMFIYTYDANGNIIAVNDGSTTKTYVYDKLNRLVEIQPASGNKTVYTYDLRGNRLTQSSDNLNLNLVNTDYSYELKNKLESVIKGSAWTFMEYYADGLRAGKYTTTSSDLYVYDLSDRLVAEARNSYSITTNYVWGPDRVISKKDTGGGEYYYLYNGHGDVIQMVDRNGNVVNNYNYDEWGNITTSFETVRNPFKYAGEVYDSETGLYYLRSRYYDPALGRFINEDSLEGQVNNPLSMNLYTYCHNNPLLYIDPSGHKAAMISYEDAAIGRTLFELLKASTRSAWYDYGAKDFSLSQQYYLAWFYGSKAYERLDSMTLSSSSYVVYGLEVQRRKGIDISRLTISDIDKMCFNISSAFYKIDTSAVAIYSGYSMYKIAKAQGMGGVVHGNSASSTKVQHGYEIFEIETGDVVKTGISGRPLNKNLTSPRANSQVNAWNREAGFDKYNATIAKTNIPGRQAALDWEVNNAMKLWEEGNSMSKHSRPAPWK